MAVLRAFQAWHTFESRGSGLAAWSFLEGLCQDEVAEAVGKVTTLFHKCSGVPKLIVSIEPAIGRHGGHVCRDLLVSL